MVVSDRSVLAASGYNAWPEAFNGQAYAFLNVIRMIEGADILAPEALPFEQGRACGLPSAIWRAN